MLPPLPAFTCSTGTVQLFIACSQPSLFVAASSAQYDRDKPVATEAEQRIAQAACDQLNAEWNSGRRDFTEEDVRRAVRAQR